MFIFGCRTSEYNVLMCTNTISSGIKVKTNMLPHSECYVCSDYYYRYFCIEMADKRVRHFRHINLDTKRKRSISSKAIGGRLDEY